MTPRQPPRLVYIDPALTSWCDPFFAQHAGLTGEQVLRLVARQELDVDEAAAADDMKIYPLAGVTYWLVYLTGYCEYRSRHLAVEHNLYLDYLRRYFHPRGHDPGLTSVLVDPKLAAERVRLRFTDLDIMRVAAPNWPRQLSPVRAGLKGIAPPAGVAVVDTATEEAIDVAWIDGYHRLFSARLLHVRRVPCWIEHGEGERVHR